MTHKSWNRALPIACVSTTLLILTPLTHAGESEVTLTGHINRAIWYADDGVDTNTSFVDNNVFTQYANRIVSFDRSLEHKATGNCTELGGLEDVTHFCQTDNFFLYLG